MKKAWIPALLAVAALAAISLVACSPPMLSGPGTDAEKRLRPSPSGPRVIQGETRTGALFAIHFPARWNGDLVLYAHGYVDPALPVSLPGEDEVGSMRDLLLSMGYAVAYSSYSDTGWDIRDAADCTRKLITIFSVNFGKPKDVFVVGVSMGGMIALMLAEKDPMQISGVVTLSGPVGGSILEMQYVANVRALVDYFYPGVVPGSATFIPDGVDFEKDVQIPLGTAFKTSALHGGFPRMAMVDQTAVPYYLDEGSDPAEDAGAGIIGALWLQVVGTNDLVEQAHGRLPVSNLRTVYTIGGVKQPDINKCIERFASSPAAVDYLRHNYQPTGKLRIPVLTLHTTGDGIVPIRHEAAYKQIVDARGRSDLLVQRTIGRAGHVTFAPNEIFQAFQDLVMWVKLGMKPEP